MLFAIDNDDDDIEVAPKDARSINGYKFKGVKLATEDEILNHYKMKLFTRESMQRLETIKAPSINTSSRNTSMSGVSMSSRYAKAKIRMRAQIDVTPTRGMYIVPKMFGYFPFMDCDDQDTFEECKFNLTMDSIPYVAYRSNPQTDSYWIFCDKQMPLMETIEFIERYPNDHRYSWIAKYKKELCVRALPKNGGIPSLDEEYFTSSFTNDFKYWISEFNDYWINGKVSKYIEMIETANAI